MEEQKKKIFWAETYIDEDELNEVIETVKSTWISKGPKVKKFEELVRSRINSKHCVAVNSGTAALDIALKILEIGPGDEVIVPAMTYIATANSVLYQHAIPIFADIEPKTFTIDPEDVRKKITDKTKAIIAVDYAGHGADYQKLREVIGEKKIYLIEDGAPGFGGEQNKKKLCSLGDIGITSFHTAKIFTSAEGGMLFTDNNNYAEKARIILNQGEDPHQKYYHPVLGHNYRMTDLHASIGLAQVARFDVVLEKRKQLAEYYTEKINLLTSFISTPSVLPNNKHAWFLYPLIIENRDEVFNLLKEKGITTNVSWPMPIYRQPYYKKFFKEICPVAEEMTKKVLCLPMYYSMSHDDQDYVIRNLVDVVEKLSKT